MVVLSGQPERRLGDNPHCNESCASCDGACWVMRRRCSQNAEVTDHFLGQHSDVRRLSPSGNFSTCHYGHVGGPPLTAQGNNIFDSIELDPQQLLQLSMVVCERFLLLVHSNILGFIMNGLDTELGPCRTVPPKGIVPVLKAEYRLPPKHHILLEYENLRPHATGKSSHAPQPGTIGATFAGDNLTTDSHEFGDYGHDNER